MTISWKHKQPRVRAYKITEYGGTKYHSQAEANYARELDLRVCAGDIIDWDRQIRCPLFVNGARIGMIVVDFLLLHKDGSVEYVEIKGHPTELWRFKWRVFEACSDIKAANRPSYTTPVVGGRLTQRMRPHIRDNYYNDVKLTVVKV